jgi:N,N-dimethylformamidase beta subunit-like protein
VAVWAIAAGAEDRRAEYALARHVAVVGWADTGDLSGAGSRTAVRDRLALAYPSASPDAIDSWADQLWAFVHGIADGDMVAMRLGRQSEVAFGRVTGPYGYDTAAPGNRRHQRPVRWVRQVPWASLEPALRAELQSPAAVHRLRDPGSALVDPEPPGRHLSRRAFVTAGAAAAAAAAIAAIWRPWDSSSSPTALHTPVPSRGGGGSSGVSSSPNGPVAQWVKDENAKPGTTAWNVTNGGKPGDVEGYASAVSALRGETVTLYVSTTAPTFHVEAYRMGWYKGAGGRFIWRSPEMPGKKQAAPTLTPGTNMTEARWDPSLKVTIDNQYPPGVYLFKLVGSNGIQQLVPLTVRDDASTATYVVQNSVTSWQAYNDWAGYNLYNGQNGAFATRARVVSFDRPYARGDGQADFLGLEFPLIMMMEQLGLDVTYITDVDTHARPQLLLKHKMWFSLGHDEYWSKEMRDGVEGARDKGVNLAFLGANAAFRQIRFEPSAIGPNRHEVCYKAANEDPIHATNPALTTVNWRDAPVSRPESQMIGQQYECNPVNADMVVVDPTAWVFNGTGVKAGQKLPNAVGSEYDRFDPAQSGPKTVQIFAHSPVVCHGRPSFADMTYYNAPSGAGVFSTGTIVWITKLTPPGPGSPNDAVAIQVTKNVITAFGTGPAARQHQAVSNYAAVARQYGLPSGHPQGTD